MYAVLGEDNSDVEMINVLIRRIAGKSNLKVKTKGYEGCAELLIKGARMIRTFRDLGCSRFVICYDADRSSPQHRYREIIDKIVIKSGVIGSYCALVPVQEIESWILSDIHAVTKLIPSWRPTKGIISPEGQNDPKEFLEKLSRCENHKPLYTHALHNPKIAQHLNLKSIAIKCPSSLPLFELVQTGIGNHPIIQTATDERTKIVIKALTLAGHS